MSPKSCPGLRWLGALATAATLSCFVLVPSSSAADTAKQTNELRLLAERFRQQELALDTPSFRELVRREARSPGAETENSTVQLVFLSERGEPFFLSTDNAVAAASINTDLVFPTGGNGFFLTGAETPLGQLAVWDSRAVRLSHQEFGGRVVQADSATIIGSHSTHVAGTLIAAGVDAAACGMSHQASLLAYDWNDPLTEITNAAAAGTRVSSHSYSRTAGWYFGYTDPEEWNWFGDVEISRLEDYGFGFYWQRAAEWDEIAFNAPHYMIVTSAANDRDDVGPGFGAGHYHWRSADSTWVWATDLHGIDGGATGYDTMNWHNCAKNIITVGAVRDIPEGWSSPEDVVMTVFSNWGPTDDGRIKPDIVANGVLLYSPTASGDQDYESRYGTSMACPSIAGSLNLLVNYYRETHGVDPRSSTLKAVVVQTANEAGDAAGPDYSFGWGLMNTLGAVQIIQADDVVGGHLFESTLAVGTVDERFFVQQSNGPVRLTVAWTDPPGTPPPPSLDPTTPMLVNDLDLLLENVSTAAIHRPWVLDPANPELAATTGDNVLDNTEQIHVDDLPPGLYRVTISHKGDLLPNSEQVYSLASSVPLSSDDATAVTIQSPASSWALHGATPNPIRDGATIRFQTGSTSHVSLRIYDVAGRLVRTLVDSRYEAGAHSVPWQGHDEVGRRLGAGIYFVRLESPALQETKRVVVLR